MKKEVKKINVFAVLSLIFSILIAPLGIVFGFIALSQIKKIKHKGKVLAIIGIVIGIVLTILILLLLITLFWFSNVIAKASGNCDISNNTALQEFVGREIQLDKNYTFFIYGGTSKGYNYEKIESGSSIIVKSFRLIYGFDIPAHIELYGQIRYNGTLYDFDKPLAYRAFNRSSNSSKTIVSIPAFNKAFEDKDLYKDFNC